MKVKTKKLVIYALMASLTSVCSQIVIPLPFTPIPISLATLAVMIAGGLCGFVGGGVSQLIYIMLGIIGLPVFANFSGGIGIIFGPTGGFIIGYILLAMISGFIINRFGKKIYMYPIAMVIGLIICYTMGTLWFMILTGNNLVTSLILCVVPFLFGEVIKIIIASLVIYKLKQRGFSHI